MSILHIMWTEFIGVFFSIQVVGSSDRILVIWHLGWGGGDAMVMIDISIFFEKRKYRLSWDTR